MYDYRAEPWRKRKEHGKVVRLMNVIHTWEKIPNLKMFMNWNVMFSSIMHEAEWLSRWTTVTCRSQGEVHCLSHTHSWNLATSESNSMGSGAKAGKTFSALSPAQNQQRHITMDLKCVIWLLYFAPVLQLATIKSESRLKHLLQRLPGYCPESMVSSLPLLQ